MQYRLCAGVLVEQDGRVLLVRHLRPGKYDFWVAPGGGVQGDESLAQAAQREAREETGLDVEPMQMAYVEEFMNPEARFCKFWFVARATGGRLSVAAPEAQVEHIVEAAWLSPHEMEGKAVFPPVLQGRYWSDRLSGFPATIQLPLRQMDFW